MVALPNDPFSQRSVIKNQFKYGHNLNRSIHGAEVHAICRELYLNKYPLKDVYRIAMDRFLANNPDCWCRDYKTFKKWAGKTLPSFQRIAPTEEIIAQAVTLIRERFEADDYRRVTTTKEVHAILNRDKRVITLAQVTKLWHELHNKYAPRTPTSEWKIEYVPVLIELYQTRLSRYNSFVDAFNRRTKTRFPIWFLQEKIADHIETYGHKSYQNDGHKELDNHHLRIIHENVVDFKKRGYDKQTIKEKISLYLKMEELPDDDKTVKQIVTKINKAIRTSTRFVA